MWAVGLAEGKGWGVMGKGVGGGMEGDSTSAGSPSFPDDRTKQPPLTSPPQSSQSRAAAPRSHRKLPDDQPDTSSCCPVKLYST